jgi:O-antigen/teichoic acid export membrane protein
MSALEEARVARFHRIVDDARSRMDFKTASVRGGAYTSLALAVDFVIRMGSIVVLARLLLPEHFGLLAMVVAITTVAERFKDLGLSLATVQSREITHQQVSTLFWINAALGLGTALVVSALSIPISRFYGDDRLVGITLAIASTFLWGGLTIQHEALLRRTMRFGLVSCIGLGASIASMAIAVALAVAGFGYWSLVLRDVSRSVLLAIGLWWACPWVPSLPTRGSGAGAMMRFGGHVAIVQMVTLLSQNVGAILIGRVFGAGPVGLYRQSQNVVQFPFDQLSYPVWVVSEPALSRLQDEAERYRRYFGKVMTVFSGIAMPLATFLVIYADSVVLVVLGPQWTEATIIFQIMAVAAFVSPISSTIGLVMVTCGQSKRYMALGLLGAGVLVGLSLVGTLWGPNGVAWAHVWAACLLLWPRLHFGLKGTQVSSSLFLKLLVRPFVASVAMGVVLLLLRAYGPALNPASGIALGMAIGFLVFAGCWLALPGGRAEAAQLWGHVLAARPGQG